MKRLLRLLVIVLVLIVVGIIVLGYNIDRLAKNGIEGGMTETLGASTTLDDISISFFSQNCDMKDFKIANSPGFSADPIFELGRGMVEVSATSLTSDLIEVPRIELDGIRLRLEQKNGVGNYDAILDRMAKMGGSDKPKDEDARRFVVREIVIRDTIVQASLNPLGDALATPPIEVKIPEIRLKDVGSDSSKGMTLAEIGSQILGTVFVKVGDDVSGTLPQLIAQGLTRGLADLPQLNRITEDLQGGVSQRIQGLLKGGSGALDQQLKGATDQLQKGVDESIKKGLDSILGGDKKK